MGCRAGRTYQPPPVHRVPHNLLTPLTYPPFSSRHVTVEGLIIQIKLLELVVDKANERFVEIHNLQEINQTDNQPEETTHVY